jgi:tRNA threonylcarbamoyladenosine biosynthesis protein TsaE
MNFPSACGSDNIDDMKKLLLRTTGSASETEKIARDMAAVLRPGDIVALYGPVGSGKTCFVRGLARGLGCSQKVKSPSFSLVNEYSGGVPLYHIDFYRLEKEAEIINLGWTDYLDSDGVVAIEWAERVRNMLPSGRFDVYLDFLGSKMRRVEILAGDNIGDRHF